MQVGTGRVRQAAESALGAYRAVGLLVVAAAAMTAVAAILHHRSALLPHAYTIFEPLSTLEDVLVQPGFMVAALATVGVAHLRLRSEWRASVPTFSSAWWRRELPQEASLRHFAPRAALAFVVVLGYVALRGGEGTFDLPALAVLVLVAVARARPVAEWLRLGAKAVVAGLVFLSICYAYTIFKSLTFVERGDLDAGLVAVEKGIFGVVPHRVVAAWVAGHPTLLATCDWAYFRFFHHMALTSVLLVSLRQKREQTEYLGALALCYVVGGPLYHLIPAAGPRYFDPRPFAFLSESDSFTNVIYGWLEHNTRAVLAGRATVVRTWGYIACMPSLHVAQELVMLYYARHSRLALALASAFTAVTLLAVVALGWHYPLDCIGGGLVAALAIKLAHSQRRTLLPRVIGDEENVALPARRSGSNARVKPRGLALP